MDTRIPIMPKEIAPTIAIRGGVSSTLKMIAATTINRVVKNLSVFQLSLGNRGFLCSSGKN